MIQQRIIPESRTHYIFSHADSVSRSWLTLQLIVRHPLLTLQSEIGSSVLSFEWFSIAHRLLITRLVLHLQILFLLSAIWHSVIDRLVFHASWWCIFDNDIIESWDIFIFNKAGCHHIFSDSLIHKWLLKMLIVR